MLKTKIKNYPIVSPIPVVLVGAEVNGKPNYAAVGAFGVVCLEPVLYVSLKSTHYTTVGVKETGFFSVNIPSAGMVQKTDFCGMVSGKGTDKSGLFTPFYDELGKAPLIEECPLNFLCKTIQTISIYGFDAFFGEVVATYLNEDCFTCGQPDPLKINPTLLMGMGYFDLSRRIGNAFQEGKILKAGI